MTAQLLRASVYVHFPWCLAKCPYCDFVSYVDPAIDHGGYADAILRELEARAPAFAGRMVESVFFGGGTPSLWATDEVGRVLSGIRSALPISDRLEVTIECNPTSLDEDKARALVDVGINRVSIGVQSLDNDRLRFLGRLHDGAGALAALRGARRAGVPRISGDLIFGLPGQAPSEARDEALRLADEGLTHVSCYQLTIEPKTRFGELAKRGRLPLADDGAVADAFVAIDEALSSRGLEHYEISNYARPGDEARHNLGYWRGDEYLGLGCGAVGFVRTDGDATDQLFPHVAETLFGQSSHRDSASTCGARGVRWRNAVQPERYMEAARGLPSSVAAGEAARGLPSPVVAGETARGLPSPVVAGETARGLPSSATVGGPGETCAALCESVEELDGEAILRERIMLGLRVRDGIDLQADADALNTAGWSEPRLRAAQWLEERGRIVREGRRMRIPPSAWLWADDTCARLF